MARQLTLEGHRPTCVCLVDTPAKYRDSVLEPYGGRVDLFRATETLGELDHGWRQITPDLHVHTAPGDHFSVVREPNVRHLADRLTALIASLELPDTRDATSQHPY